MGWTGILPKGSCGTDQWYTNKCLTISHLDKKKCFVAYTNFHGINTATLADVSLTVQRWVEMSIICPREPTPVMTDLSTIRKNELWLHKCYRRGKRVRGE